MPSTTEIIADSIVGIIIAIILTPFFLALKVGFDVLKDLHRGDEEYEYWRWGMFYYNKNDERLFVPHRYGRGVALNFGNRYARILIVAQLIFIAIIICIRYFKH